MKCDETGCWQALDKLIRGVTSRAKIYHPASRRRSLGVFRVFCLFSVCDGKFCFVRTQGDR